MRTIKFLFILSVVVLLSAEYVAAQTPQNDGFMQFYANFRTVVAKHDRSGLRELMSERFQYAMDNPMSRDEALKNIEEIIGWKKFWSSTKIAVSKEAERCKKYQCNDSDRPGYHVWTSEPNGYGLIFERGIDGKWHWIELRGD